MTNILKQTEAQVFIGCSKRVFMALEESGYVNRLNIKGAWYLRRDLEELIRGGIHEDIV